MEEAPEMLKREQPDAAVLEVHLSDGNATPVAAVLKTIGVAFVLTSAIPPRKFLKTSFFRARRARQATDTRKLLAAIKALLQR